VGRKRGLRPPPLCLQNEVAHQASRQGGAVRAGSARPCESVFQAPTDNYLQKGVRGGNKPVSPTPYQGDLVGVGVGATQLNACCTPTETVTRAGLTVRAGSDGVIATVWVTAPVAPAIDIAGSSIAPPVLLTMSAGPLSCGNGVLMVTPVTAKPQAGEPV